MVTCHQLLITFSHKHGDVLVMLLESKNNIAFTLYERMTELKW